LLYLVAALVLAGGALALGTLTNPSTTPSADDAEQTSTTTRTTRPQPPSVDIDTFAPDHIEVGEPLYWVLGADLTNSHPVAILAHEGWFYLFGSSTPDWDHGQASGLQAWRSETGIEWEDLGQVIPEDTKISSVASSDYGLIAMSPGPVGESFSVWRSTDGISWVETPGPPLAEGSGPVLPTAVAASDRLIVVAGQQVNDPTELLADRLEQRVGLEVDLHRYGWSQYSDETGPGISIHGPLGIPILTVSLDELNLSEQEQAIVLGAYHGNQGEASVWIRWDDSDWQHGTIDGSTWIEAIEPLPQGGFMAVGWGTTGESGWTSFDGLEWSGLEFNARPPFSLESWGDKLVGPSDNGEAGLLVSGDGLEWTDTPLYLNFPRPLSWGLGPYAAGDGGLVASVESWRDFGGPSELPDPPTLTSGEIELTLDFEMGNVIVRHGEESTSFAMWSNFLPETVQADLATESLVFRDTESGDEIGTFTFDQINTAEDEFWGTRYDGDLMPFLAHSTDGEDWSIETMERAFGPGVGVVDLAVGNGRVVALVVSSTDRFRPDPSPGFTLWSAELP